MKKLALVVGSLLAVSAVASAKEVVPAPKAVAEAPVKVVEKVVYVDKPVEKIVYRDREVIKEVVKEAPATWRPTGSFEISLDSPIYEYDFIAHKNYKLKHDKFLAQERKGTLEAKADVLVAPNHKLYVNAKAKLHYGATTDPSAISSYVGAFATLGAEATVGYNYNYKGIASIDLSTKINTPTAEKAAVSASPATIVDKKITVLEAKASNKVNAKTATVTFKVAPKFDAKEYFFTYLKNPYIEAKTLAFVPTYSYTTDEGGISLANPGSHKVTLGVNTKFGAPYGFYFGADLSKFFVYDLDMKYDNGKVQPKKASLSGEAKFFVGNEYTVFEKGAHSIETNAEFSYTPSWFWNLKYQDNNKKVDDKTYMGGITTNPKGEGTKNLLIKEHKLAAEVGATYNFKLNDFTTFYAGATLGVESKYDGVSVHDNLNAGGTAVDNTTALKTPLFKSNVATSAKLGVKVKF